MSVFIQTISSASSILKRIKIEYFLKSISLTDWTAVGERNQDINFDIRSTKLQIQTDSEIGSGDKIWSQFFDPNGGGRGITVYFDSPPVYGIGYCQNDIKIPLDKLGTDKNRIWTIELVSTRVKLFCNGIQIFDYDPQLSDNQECREKWSLGASILKFGRNIWEEDTASDFYREYKTGKQNI